jgi:hypothetical protein
VKRLVLLPLIILLGCAHGANKASDALSGMGAVNVQQPVELSLKADPSRKETVLYRSYTHTITREEGEITHQQESSTDFTIENLFEKIPGKDSIRQSMTTMKKDGQLPLSTLALPEYGEVIEMHLAPNGNVQRAGSYPPQSLYYVPQVSLPSAPVSVGDTWPLTATWYDMEDGTPFVLEMVSILKGFVACGTDQCADIEMSGDVQPAAPQGPKTQYSSHWVGRALFAKNTGTVTYMRIDSLDTLKTENASRIISSCLENILSEPANISIGKKPTCSREGVPEPVRMPK